MFITVFLFLLGFGLLVKGADILVSGASAIARFFRVPPWIIGLTVVGIGTSIPEFSITLISALKGEADIGLGTVIGSNTFNLFFILGISALIFPLVMKKDWVERGLPPNIAAVMLAGLAAAYPIFGGREFLGITRGEGVLLFLGFLLWLFYVVFRRRPTEEGESDDAKAVAIPLAALMIFGGILGVVIGGKWVVDGAVALSRAFGVREALLGLTLVGIGTSLPELAISVVAAYRKNAGIAVGNIVGSNIFDFLGILGFAAIFRPIPFPPDLYPDIMLTFFAAVLLYGALLLGRKYVLERWHGALFMFLYLLYLGALAIRG